MTARSPRLARSRAFPNFAKPAFAGLVLLLLAYQLYGFASVHSLLADFHSFWCAGAAIAHGADPYRAQPLAVCERAAQPFGLYAAPLNVVVPAPLPPYALALFVPFALLPYAAAATLWVAVLIAAIAGAVALLAVVLRAGVAPAAWMMLLPAVVLWLPYGEVTPVALLGAVIAAYGLQSQRWMLGGLGLLLLAVEPHLAMPVWLCVALFAPRARIATLAAGGFLVLLSVLVHPGALLEYAREVIPLHALAEVPRPAQYSATWFAYAAGISPGVALRIGEATYVLMAVGGIFAAHRLYRRWGDAGVLVFAPLAASVIGGAFVHASQIALALPFAAMLASRTTDASRTVAALACAMLAIPWTQTGTQQAIAVASIAVFASVVLALTNDRNAALRAALGCAIAIGILVLVHRFPIVVARAPHFPIAQSPGELASAPWGRYIWSDQSTVTVGDWLAKAPTWMALVLLAGAASASLRAPAVRSE